MRTKRERTSAAVVGLWRVSLREGEGVMVQNPAQRKSDKSYELKLTIELVPQTSWYDNMRKVMPRTQWDKLRKRVYAEYGQRCGICGATEGRLNCHEIWEYDDTSYRQKLKGFIALCNFCHFVKHIGQAGILAQEGKLDFEKVVEHFMKVNGCDRRAFEEHRQKAFEQWRERSKHSWNVDLGEYQSLVEKKEGG
jgi:hypothetical protein